MPSAAAKHNGMRTGAKFGVCAPADSGRLAQRAWAVAHHAVRVGKSAVRQKVCANLPAPHAHLRRVRMRADNERARLGLSVDRPRQCEDL